MKTRTITLALLILCGLVATPQPSAAFEVVDASVERLNDTTALFTISYEFGFLNRTLEMPAGTVRAEEARTNVVSYGFYNESGVVLSGVGPAVVLTTDADATFSDGKYTVPSGKNATFTLVGLLALPANEPFANIRLEIGNLPFTLVDEAGTARTATVPVEQLAAYRTPFISITDGLTITGRPIETMVPQK